jgi:glycosyltransferase involved in cell wall biosynthesis
MEVEVVSSNHGLREERVRRLSECLSGYPGALVVPVGVADAADAVAILKSRGGAQRLLTCLHGHTQLALAEARRVAPYTDLAVSVSRHGARVLTEAIGLPDERVRHIPFGVDIHDATPREDAVQSPLRIAYVGRLEHSEKRVRDLIAIADLMRGTAFEIDIVGEGPERSALEEAFKEDIAVGRVRSRGYLGPGELRDRIYREVDALLVLSPSEGGPIAAWEAMAHGVVPVVSDFLGRAEEPIWEPGRNCLVFPVGDTSAAAQQLRRLFDRELRARLGERARLLPPAYRRTGFLEAWQAAIESTAALPSRGGDVQVRTPTSAGRLAKLPALRLMLRRLARAAGRKYEASNPGDEWPATYG